MPLTVSRRGAEDSKPRCARMVAECHVLAVFGLCAPADPLPGGTTRHSRAGTHPTNPCPDDVIEPGGSAGGIGTGRRPRRPCCSRRSAQSGRQDPSTRRGTGRDLSDLLSDERRIAAAGKDDARDRRDRGGRGAHVTSSGPDENDATAAVERRGIAETGAVHRSMVSQRRGDKAMSSSISTLLTRNLNDVFGENDPARRRAAIDQIYTDDCVFHEPRGVYHGRDEIHRVAGAIKAAHPDFRYQPIAPPEEFGQWRAVRWVSGRAGEAQRTPGLISSPPGWPDCGRISLFRPVTLSFQRRPAS